MRKTVVLVLFAMMMLLNFGTVSAEEKSPEWVGRLEAAKDAKQIVVVAGIGKTTAWVSMHEKDANGNWQQIMTTPGIIGKNGLGKTKEGDAMTPIGVFHFNRAFGIKKNPGCTAFDYVKVDSNMYWSSDPKYKYNELINIQDYPDLNKEDSEHLIDYPLYYDYALNISYNEECIADKGSGIFLHCFGPFKPYTGGCVAVPEDKMLIVMKKVKKDCVVVIDYLQNLSPETHKALKL